MPSRCAAANQPLEHVYVDVIGDEVVDGDGDGDA